MAKQFIYHYCKHEFYTDESEKVICPACGREVKKDTTEEPLI